MSTITIVWIALPFFFGFLIYLLPKLDKYVAMWVCLASLAYGLQLFFNQSPLTLKLLDNFGVILAIDQISGYFILTNALVTAAVILYCWHSDKTAFFYAQTIILHGSVNAAFVCADLISLYVALEVSGIAAFLLIAYPRSDRSIWVGLRYLFISNVAMLFYLVGAVLVYQADHSFSFAGLRVAPTEALALIFLGLLTKGGIFVSGLWLPLTHSESETPVSAMLSGVVVKAGVYPLVRCALMVDEIDPMVRTFGVCTALLGVFYAVFEKDTKRMLAFHTVSQLGFILAAPKVGGFYALTHGLVKAVLFLIAGALPSRNFKELQHQAIATPVWIALVMASFSISGFPLLSGFGAKVLTTKNLLPWQAIAMNVAALGTAISFAKFIFLPRGGNANVKPGFWGAVILLIGGLVVANIVYYEAYTYENIIKPLATIGIGWLAYWLIFKRLALKLPRVLEQFDHLIGVMSLILILLFWKGFAWLGI
ncbi:monovalent cation/H+ antiporter subunit D [Nostoc linckia z18]|uniref:Monovalent cation/H+ antiporter subunit D n=2 Tax=Nostoc linckia TaxID=92942 RepID=A0A9Q5ZBC0_NOSLI|nr:cation:proton antiporter [Nostoc linckia]PHK42147.1 monovalent cation/H+ antiporter subunit D [Nostoc linckia z15]PHK47301.1 monovalent cation/H+ antiporter subunit D [Nostoc linckia z16]PHJ58851.1 monovalent cation/H+ antiporter subunit D [Nostoc linckia z3]PHJ63114.1 monovalent cation/H+ antiporter subunit D [Nostoc linckia z1]PHJ75737.1 monovalent cation/H+ antiporter subunit D [Nostoc linckia z2]